MALYAIFQALNLFLGFCMRWQIAQYIFCDQQQTLTLDGSSQQLEPMMVELLSYFCQHPDMVLSKDRLIEQVWLGRIVSDNAVSKLITKLRKVFNDDARQPKFIATLPKKGYKFIASVKAINESDLSSVIQKTSAAQTELAQQNIERSEPSKIKQVSNTATLLIFIALAACYVAWQYFLPSTQKLPQYAKAITTDAGDEFFPAVSPDGNRVAYMSVHQDKMQLKLKSLVDERTVEIVHGDDVGVGPANWSADGKLLVYLVANSKRCQYFISKVAGLNFSEPRLIHNCPAGSYGQIAFTHQNDRLIYSESEGRDSPYVLFELNLTSNKIKRLHQPELFLGGNSQFDLHPTENKLLISSPDKQQWERFYALDLETEQLSLLFKQDAYICCGIWSHDGNRVVLMGEHPAYQLLSYDLSGNDKQVLYSGSRQIRRPTRHSNGFDYLFSSGKGNSNVFLLDIETKNQHVVANTSVEERLATFSHSGHRIAYVGLGNDAEEIWLTDIEGTQPNKLTKFADSRHYIDLIWSPNDEHLLALTLNEIHLIDVETGLFERVKIPQTEIRAVSFKSASVISFSIQVKQQWQAYSYLLDKQQLLTEDSQWQFIQYQQPSENTLWLDQNNQLYFGDKQQAVFDAKIPNDKFIDGRQFNLKKRRNTWYWFERGSSSKIQKYSEHLGTSETLLETNVGHFDVSGSNLLFGKTQQVDADIYQTQSIESH